MRKLYLLLVVMLALAVPAVTLAAEGDTATVELTGKTGYEDITGTATFTDNGDGTTMVSAEIENAPDGASPAHLHDGTSCDESKPVLHPLTDFVDGNSETTLDEPFDELVADNYYLNIHLSADDLGTVIACGDTYETQGGDDQDDDDMPGAPNAGGGGTSGQDGAPMAGLAVIAALLAAGAFSVIRPRSI